MATKASQHDIPEILPGVDFVKGGTVVTEVDCGPTGGRNGSKGLLSKAKKLAERFSINRTGSGLMRNQHADESGEQIEMSGPGESGGVIVSYDVWRTVEESDDKKKGGEDDSLGTR
jgi:hypothetical protein